MAAFHYFREYNFVLITLVGHIDLYEDDAERRSCWFSRCYRRTPARVRYVRDDFEQIPAFATLMLIATARITQVSFCRRHIVVVAHAHFDAS